MEHQRVRKSNIASARQRMHPIGAALLLIAACASEPESQSVDPAASASTPATTQAPTPTLAGDMLAPTAASPSTATATSAATPVPAEPAADKPAAAAGAGSLPCAVDAVLKASCQSCHGATPIGGAPMALVTYADLMKPGNTQPNKKVYELVQERVHDTKRPMPPIGSLMPDDIAALDAWVAGGVKAVSEQELASCSSAPRTASEWEGARALDGSRGKLTPGPGETCYEFKVHGGQTADDTTKFTVTDGEFYEQFYYSVPWPAGTVATAYATLGDNAQVLHHWLLFSTNELQAEGTHIVAPYPTLIGTDPILLAGWAVGGPNLVAPENVGFELPDPGRTINVQWHFYNSTGQPQADASSVQICTVPTAMREHTGGVTWLGTEDLYGNVWFGGQGMPPKQKSSFTTTCNPGRAGVAADEPIHILGFEPHMHRIGKHMKTEVRKTDGTVKTIFDEPFSFGNETHYFSSYDLLPGEELITTCTFDNDNDFGVMFGESSDTEMCYQFTFAYPAHALTNNAPSILGVPDTCWGSTTPKQITSIQ
jgi:mono/diheme cytochrome c family protein